jgi:hypothetical protein
MRKGGEIKVRWRGPDGKIRQNSNKILLKLFSHEELKRHFDIRNIRLLRKDVWKALRYLRRLYRTYDLISPYHNFGHNYVTTITAFRAFVGALKSGRKFSFSDLNVLLFATLFHDTGYLRKSKFAQKRGVMTHSAKSTDFTKAFLITLNWSKERISEVAMLQSFTKYARWELKKLKYKGNPLAKILVGADLTQCFDLNYAKNLTILREILFTNKMELTRQSQQKFYKFVKEVTGWIWKYLDEFYGGKDKNPYRFGWERFRRLMRDEYGVKI